MTLIIANGAVPAPSGGVVSSDQLAVSRDLVVISLGDTKSAALQPSATLGDQFVEVDYHQSVSGFGPNLLSFLVNASVEVVIHGVDKASVGSLGGPTGLGGSEFDPTIKRVTVFYDTTQCNNRGAHVFDTGGKKIPDPSFIILAHELYHARDFITGAINNATPEPEAEKLAIIGENQSRKEIATFLSVLNNISVDLGQRDPNNHNGGCDPVGSTSGSFWADQAGCFIATAAYGSASDTNVRRFREFRDQKLRGTHWGRAFFQRLYAEYYSYSPRIAADMRASPALRQTVSSLLVGPFLDFLTVAELALSGPQKGIDFVERLESILARDPEIDATAIVYALDHARVASLTFNPAQRPRPPVSPQPTGPLDQVKYVVQLVLAFAPTTEFTRWALIDPLCLHWVALERIHARHDPIDRVASAYMDGLAGWISNMPLPPLLAQWPAETLAKDLTGLGKHTFRTPAARRQVADRLLSFADLFPYELLPLLAQAGWWHGVE
jgi:hypothetical protein